MISHEQSLQETMRMDATLDTHPPSHQGGDEKNVTFTHEEVSEYATIQLEGQYRLAAYLVNGALQSRVTTINNLVDFGSGAGKSTRAVEPSVRAGGRIIGVDISEDFVKEARSLTSRLRANSPVEYEYRRIVIVNGREVIPIGDAEVDAVTTAIVLQEMQSEHQLMNALAEMGRIAKPGAVLAAACVSDRIVDEDYTTFTYAGFPENGINARNGINIRQCASTVSRIVWDQDRHWSAGLLTGGFARGGWIDIKVEYPLAPDSLRPFPSDPRIDWKDELRVAPIVLITAIKGY